MHGIATKDGGHYSNSEDDVLLLQLPSDDEPAKEQAATKSAGTSNNNVEGDLMAYRHRGVLQNQGKPSDPTLVPPARIRKAGKQGGCQGSLPRRRNSTTTCNTHGRRPILPSMRRAHPDLAEQAGGRRKRDRQEIGDVRG